MINLVDKILKEIKPSESEILNFSGYWIPLQWVYVELVKNKGIEPLVDIEETEKKRFKELAAEGPRYKRIWLIQALYAYNQLKS